MTIKQTYITDLRIDGGTQPRGAMDMIVVQEYADAITEGAAFPPVTVYYDGSAYWLADGFHRLAAYKRNGAHTIPADIRQGTQRDAVLHSVGANATHGLRRSNDDKRRAICTLLRDPEWRDWSDHEIARRTGTDAKTVGNVRRALVGTGEIPQSDARKGGDGRVINTANIGSAPAAPPARQPVRSLEEAADLTPPPLARPTPAPAPAPRPAPTLTPAAPPTPPQTLAMPPKAAPAYMLSVRILPGDERLARRCTLTAGLEGAPPAVWKSCTVAELDEHIAAVLDSL